MRTALRLLVVFATIGALLAPGATLVSAAGISVSPNSGAIGTATNVNGNGFAPNATVTVRFNGPNGTQIGTQSTNGSGHLPDLTVTIPSVVAGTYQIFATDGTNTATSNFTVPSSLTLSPSSGGQNTSVTVNGTGYLSGEGISIAWDQPGTQVATATANSNGGFSATFTVPSSSGAHTVLATGQSSQFAQSATFSVSGNTGGANLSVNPNSGVSGTSTTVTLTGSGFNANEQVNIAVDNGGTAASVTADGNGMFSTPLALSSSLSLGAHTISATGVSSGHVAFTTFTVTSTAQATSACNSGSGDQDNQDDSRPGNGFGDSNHCHSGPPGHQNDNNDNGGHGNDGNGHGHGHGQGHGDGGDQGGDS